MPGHTPKERAKKRKKKKPPGRAKGDKRPHGSADGPKKKGKKPKKK